MSAEFKKLVMKRKTPFNRLKEIYEYGVGSTTDKFYKQNFSARTEFVEAIYEEFQDFHNQIISLITDDTQFDEEDKVRVLADKYLYGIRSKKLELSPKDSRSTISQSNSNPNYPSTSGNNVKGKLPKINLPVFEGNLKLWPSFFDLFNSIIHNNSSLSKIEKYHYLLTSLKNEPFNLLKAIPMVEDNYQIAYDTLASRYQNKRFLATTYFNEIYMAQPLQKHSPKDLRNLLDIFSENLAALKVLKFNTDSWDFVLFNILLQKLDAKTRTDFELEHSTTDMPTFKILTTFLTNHCKALESVQCMVPASFSKYKGTTPQVSTIDKDKGHLFKRSTTPSAYLTSAGDHQKCIVCSASHALHRCHIFLAKTPHDRVAFVKGNNLCANCLRGSHSTRNCPSSITCKICQYNHHTTLHLNFRKPDASHSATPSGSTGPVDKDSITNRTDNSIDKKFSNLGFNDTVALQCSTSNFAIKQSTVLLSTAEVDIKDCRGNFQRVRILFDTASMANFISERCFNRLGLKRQRCSVPIEGLNNQVSRSTKGITQCLVKPCGKDGPTFSFESIILPNLCSNQPKIHVNPHNWSHIRNLTLADSKFSTPGPIDMLFGAELVPFMLGPGRIFGDHGTPAALETVFGWVLQGKIECASVNTSLLSCHAALEPQIDYTLQKFWELDQVPKESPIFSLDDHKCETIYKTSVRRDISGRFVVPLPFKCTEPDFGDSYSQALRRFISLESRLYRNPHLLTAYSEFMKEYIQHQYISEVNISNYKSLSAFYLPHHCVVKPDNTSTKFRVVFDASAKSVRGISLNDTLFSGPKLHQDLSIILLKFRIHKVAFICDIKQMYCQILVLPEHRRFQRFLWRFSRNEEIKEFTLNRVSFGVSSAPYLALRTLQELAILEKNTYPAASKVLLESIYVDDCCTGAGSVDAALQLQAELIAILKRGGFELRKWASNHPYILAAVPTADTQMSLNFDTDGARFIKVLGLQWNPTLDVFSYFFSEVNSTCTKRGILSQIARIFDPLGFLAPVILLAKYIMQRLWLSKCDWDTPVIGDICDAWNRLKSELPELSSVQLPRCLIPENISRLEMHGFCDASTTGYGCVIYFRSITNSGQIKITLISGKSRVAPLRVVSIPRLELCAAYLLSDLIFSVKEAYSDLLTFDALYAWSDSQVTLAWLANSPHRWKTFIANRVSHIQEIVPPSSWRYVPTDFNSADSVSRGMFPLQLLENVSWWQGPTFLLEREENWPEQPSILFSKDVSQEERPQVSLHISIPTSSIANLLIRFSSLRKIQRILCYVFRFIAIKTKSKVYTSVVLTQQEIYCAFQAIIKHVQNECFSDIFMAFKNNTSLSKPVRKLAPFVDKSGLIRVGGRLRKSTLSFEVKHPILLPKNHRFTDLVIQQTHNENLHPGLKTLHNILLQTFWILSPRSAIYRCISKCVRCFRTRPQTYIPVMADLPSFRIAQVKAFSHVSLDYAGPFTIRLGKHRGAKTLKAYICIFVCCATKAVHVELSSDLSTDTFLASFRRFIARRGRVSDMYSDQGTNFKGANNQLILFSQAAARELSINWHFNPPAAPHFNGLSEAGVKSIKTHLRRVVGEQIMTYEEFYTLLTQIEALLNSRPLSAISEDPNDLTPLTPGHFLTMETLNSFPEPDLSNVAFNRLSRWQMVQRMNSDFWKRWKEEYLHTLQQRSKWLKSTPNIALGMLVLIKHELRPPLEWALGRVVKLHPGEDGVVRVVTLKTHNGIYQRPVVKLCPLPGQFQ